MGWRWSGGGRWVVGMGDEWWVWEMGGGGGRLVVGVGDWWWVWEIGGGCGRWVVGMGDGCWGVCVWLSENVHKVALKH